MIVSVVSPHTKNNGNTLVSILLSLGLSNLKRKVFLTHAKPKSDAFYQYLGLTAYEDKTTTPTQLVKLMREGAIKPEEITDYCKNVIDYLDVFTNNKSNFTEEDMATLLDYVLDTSVHDFKVIDIDVDFDDPIATDIIKKSDVVILNVTQSYLELSQFLENREKIVKLCSGKVMILVCNKFSSTISKDKDVSKKLGVKTRCNVIHYNPWLAWGCNNGKLVDVYKQIKLKDSRVMELFADINNLANLVSKARLATLKKKKGGSSKW